MSFSYDLATAIGKVRLFIPDNNESGGHVFEDEELQVFLDQTGDNIRLAAALALETAAADNALKLKVGKVLDIQIDSAALGDFLMKRAKRLREDAAQADSAGAATLGFVVAQQGHGVFGPMELLEKELIRQRVN